MGLNDSASSVIQTVGSTASAKVSRAYEPTRNLLTQVTNQAAGAVVSLYDYTNDPLGRRTQVKHSGSAFAPAGPAFELYGYNDRSEVLSGERYFGSNTN